MTDQQATGFHTVTVTGDVDGNILTTIEMQPADETPGGAR